MQWTESSGSVEKFPIHWFLVLEDYMPICELMPYDLFISCPSRCSVPTYNQNELRAYRTILNLEFHIA